MGEGIGSFLPDGVIWQCLFNENKVQGLSD